MPPNASPSSPSPKAEPKRFWAEILGDVQGVGFRFFAERRANQLGLRGWVRNRYDGAVEVDATQVSAGQLGASQMAGIQVRVGERHIGHTPAADEDAAE